jgi:hypothetical protein
MPLYEYQCQLCRRVYQRHFTIERRKRRIKCDCGKMAQKLCRAEIVRDVPAWLRSASDYLIEPGRGQPALETRAEWQRHLDKHGIFCSG